MSDHAPPMITDADVRSLAAKLKGLHAVLPPGEQALLQAFLGGPGRPCEPAQDTEGFVWAVSFNPFPYLDAIAIAIRRERETRGS
jgi:hypothetical protein